MTAERDLDVVLYGATGFVGRLTARYLAEHAPEGARIGLGGRSEAKLAQLRSELGARAADWPLLVADCADPAALAAMAARARAVATTVGPYQRYGFPLVQACAEAGTHYADLTGEVLFIREIDRPLRRDRARERRPDRALVRLRLDPVGPRRAGAAPRGAARRRRRARGHHVRARARERRPQRRHAGLPARPARRDAARPGAAQASPATRTRSAPTAPPSPTSARSATCSPSSATPSSAGWRRS